MPKYSYRDPTPPHVLKGWGYAATNAEGDIIQAEADDFALPPGLWAHPDATWEPHTPDPDPDPQTFLDTLLAALGTSASNALLAKYPLAFQAIQVQPYNWAVFETLAIEAHDNSDIDDAFYLVILDAIAACHLPITLPDLP